VVSGTTGRVRVAEHRIRAPARHFDRGWMTAQQVDIGKDAASPQP